MISDLFLHKHKTMAFAFEYLKKKYDENNKPYFCTLTELTNACSILCEDALAHQSIIIEDLIAVCKKYGFPRTQSLCTFNKYGIEIYIVIAKGKGEGQCLKI